ncbi:2-aminoethylphosphonate--pyruvate transaminase-like isoform X2 [Ischnura elegans]|uniref:2-aminoethylphosphonate--pyruvate transaminase-like isoform X2 n=1 Tax=Ischnura elegans TaxID=197161 RepID=UPI001ED8A57D|nr:2-aminoethylphosphonate--pyruvate transaminase-like isoform X2 [Ischnura elegans]
MSYQMLACTGACRLLFQVLIISNGSYGNRMKKICEIAKIPAVTLQFSEESEIQLSVVERELRCNPSYPLVAMVHCETSSGIINPIEKVGALVKSMLPGATFFVDAMSSFGAIPIDFEAGCVDFLVTSANKCLQGVPGFGVVIAKKSVLMQCQGRSRSLSLDLVDQLEGLEGNGQFRFTPPTHALLALRKALWELAAEGGVCGRRERYRKNSVIIQEGMRALGFKTLLPHQKLSIIITSFLYPKHPNFKFEEFYQMLSNQGQLIYPGKVTKSDSFRIGSIGDLFPRDMEHLLKCIEKTLLKMKIPIPVE